MQITAFQAPKISSLVTDFKYLFSQRLSSVFRRSNSFFSLDGRAFNYVNRINRECGEMYHFIQDWMRGAESDLKHSKESALNRIRLSDIHGCGKTEKLDLNFSNFWKPESEGLKAAEIAMAYWEKAKPKNLPSYEDIAGENCSIKLLTTRNPAKLRRYIRTFLKADGVNPDAWGIKSPGCIPGSREDKYQRSRRFSKLTEDLLASDRKLAVLKRPNEKPTLVIIKDVAIVDAIEVTKKGAFKSRLTEQKREINNGTKIYRGKSPFIGAIGEKLKSGECPAAGAIRAVDEEFRQGLKNPKGPVKLESLKFVNTLTSFGASDDFFGLQEIGVFHVFEAVINPKQFASRKISEEIGTGDNKQKVVFGFNAGVVAKRETTIKLVFNALCNCLTGSEVFDQAPIKLVRASSEETERLSRAA